MTNNNYFPRRWEERQRKVMLLEVRRTSQKEELDRRFLEIDSR
jgi:hypothetical protein